MHHCLLFRQTQEARDACQPLNTRHKTQRSGGECNDHFQEQLGQTLETLLSQELFRDVMTLGEHPLL